MSDENENRRQEKPAEENVAGYYQPKLSDLGAVEELTQGSRTETSDEPGSGHFGDKKKK